MKGVCTLDESLQNHEAILPHHLPTLLVNPPSSPLKPNPSSVIMPK